MKAKLLGIFGVMLVCLFVLSTVSAATFVTQSTRFGADKSVSTINLWADNGQGQASFAYQLGNVRTSLNAKITSYTETGTSTTCNLITSTGLPATVLVNKIAKVATVNYNGVVYSVPLTVYK